VWFCDLPKFPPWLSLASALWLGWSVWPNLDQLKSSRILTQIVRYSNIHQTFCSVAVVSVLVEQSKNGQVVMALTHIGSSFITVMIAPVADQMPLAKLLLGLVTIMAVTRSDPAVLLMRLPMLPSIIGLFMEALL
jgi:hypothetical protein